MSDNPVLFREFLRAPTQVATVTASSDALVAAMLAPLPLGGPRTVVELGPGTGRVTEALRARLGGGGHQVAVELNPVLARRLAARHRDVTVLNGDAGHLAALLRAAGVGPVDAVVSLLPWVAYANAPIPALVADVLAPHGTFAQVSLAPLKWLPPARRQERDIRARFAEFSISPTVWLNVPPARVLVARRPVVAEPPPVAG
ncbi:MAG: class I SAM-dependent methyltransferase [Pseudonocardia sp.]